MILKIVIIAIICIFTSALLKQYNKEISSLVSVCGGVLIFLLIVQELNQLFEYLKDLYSFTNLNFSFFKSIFKILAVGYITEFTADMADDFGNSAIASKVIFGGKVAICGMTLPFLKELLELLLSLLS